MLYCTVIISLYPLERSWFIKSWLLFPRFVSQFVHTLWAPLMVYQRPPSGLDLSIWPTRTCKEKWETLGQNRPMSGHQKSPKQAMSYLWPELQSAIWTWDPHHGTDANWETCCDAKTSGIFWLCDVQVDFLILSLDLATWKNGKTKNELEITAHGHLMSFSSTFGAQQGLCWSA